MKKITLLLLLSFFISACQWQDERIIKKVITDYYSRSTCVALKDIHDQRALIGLGLLTKKTIRMPSGIMGYSLEEKYILSDQARAIQNEAGNFCYGVQNISEIKNIDFANSDQATVSFVLENQITEDWARGLSFVKKGKQLLRTQLNKNSSNEWLITQ